MYHLSLIGRDGPGNLGQVTDPQTGIQTSHLMTKAQCDNTPGGSFLGGPVGLWAGRDIAAPKKTAGKAKKKTASKKSAGKK